jgi:hypothetical protein
LISIILRPSLCFDQQLAWGHGSFSGVDVLLLVMV